jgi:hypothetical protein
MTRKTSDAHINLCLATTLESLRESSEKLNELTNKAQETVRTVEKYLADCSIGIPIQVEVKPSLYLGYHISTERNGEIIKYNHRITVTDANTTIPWSDTPRDVRLLTIVKLPELLEAILKAVDDRVATAKVAVDSVKNLLSGE